MKRLVLALAIAVIGAGIVVPIIRKARKASQRNVGEM
jgi:hypothetical protein